MPPALSITANSIPPRHHCSTSIPVTFHQMSQHSRTSSYIPPATTPSSQPRKRNLSASAIPLRPPPNLRTNTSTPPTPQPVKEEDISDNENDGKDDYGDLGVTGENREAENKEDRERLK